jgi:large subunit ribosomal protein L11
MAKQTVECLVAGGKATAAPPLGTSLGPLGVNIGKVIVEINKKTAAFNGMQVPVKVIVDNATKEFEITVGTPPTSALLLKEAGVEKGSGNPLLDKVADLHIEQIIKVAKMKEDAIMGRTLKEKIKEVIGTCNSMGILVEGKQAREVIGEIDKGSYSEEIKSERTEISAEEKKELEEEKKKLAADLEKRRAELTATAKAIVESMEGKTRAEIKAKLIEAAIPTALINEMLPANAPVGDAKGAAGAKKEEPKKKDEGKKK